MDVDAAVKRVTTKLTELGYLEGPSALHARELI
jgi:hypothetical protein